MTSSKLLKEYEKRKKILEQEIQNLEAEVKQYNNTLTEYTETLKHMQEEFKELQTSTNKLIFDINPTPKKGETRDDFIKRCIPYVLKEGTAKDEKQAYAICLSMFKKSREKTNMEETKSKIFTCNASLVVQSHKLVTIKENSVEDKTINTYEIVAVIGDRFMNGGYLSSEELKKSLDMWEGTLHDINHEGIGAFSMDITKFVGYHTNARFEDGKLKLTLNIEDTTMYANAWKGYVELCKKAGKTVNVSVTYFAEQEFVKAKEIPNYESFGLHENDVVPVLKNIKPLAVSTVLIGRCNDKDGCGIDNVTENYKETKETVIIEGVVPSNPANYGKSTKEWNAPALKDFTSKSWDELSDGEKRHIASHFAWSATMPPEKFGDLKLPHHEPSGAVNKHGVDNAVARLSQTDIPEADKAKVLAHLRNHQKEFGEEKAKKEEEEIKKKLIEEIKKLEEK